jgi:hypothetical protein
MNLETDSSPTGLYNYLPRPGKTTWQKRTGRKGIGSLKQGLLKKVGYSVTDRTTRRRAAVNRAVKKYGKTSTIRKLNAVAVYTRRRSPAKSRTFRSDMKYVQKMKGGVASKDKIQAFLDKVDAEQLRVGETSMEDPALVSAPAELITEGEGLGIVIVGEKNLGNLRNATEKAHDEAIKQEVLLR